MDLISDDELFEITINLRCNYSFILVCKRFYNITNMTDYWKILYLRVFGNTNFEDYWRMLYLRTSGKHNFIRQPTWRDKYIEMYQYPKYIDENGKILEIDNLLCRQCDLCPVSIDTEGLSLSLFEKKLNKITYHNILKFLNDNGLNELPTIFTMNKFNQSESKRLLYTQVMYSGDIWLFFNNRCIYPPCDYHDSQKGDCCFSVTLLYINCRKCFRYYIRLLDILKDISDLEIRDITGMYNEESSDEVNNEELSEKIDIYNNNFDDVLYDENINNNVSIINRDNNIYNDIKHICAPHGLMKLLNLIQTKYQLHHSIDYIISYVYERY